MSDTKPLGDSVPARDRLAVFASEYPARSHTFIRREVLALVSRGWAPTMFSIRKPPREALLDSVDMAEFEATVSILPTSPLELLTGALFIIGHPVRSIRAMGASLTHRVPGFRGLLWALLWFGEACLLAGKLRQRRIRHVHVHFANAGAHIVRLAARLNDITWSMTLHGACDFEYPCGVLLQEKLEEVSFAACASSYGMSQAMRSLDVQQWDKLFVSHCGVDTSRLPVRRREGRAEVDIVCVGRLAPEKGHMGLLQAFAEAVAENGALRLTLVGDGPMNRQLHERVDKLGIGGKVSFLGAMPEGETLQRVSTADMLVLGSFMEGIPQVLVEAMAMGVAVIAPSVAGIPELIEHNVSGLMFAPAAWPELAKHMLLLAQDRSLGERLGRAAKTRIEESFSLPGVAAQLERRLERQLL